jgi:hypothetical protein
MTDEDFQRIKKLRQRSLIKKEKERERLEDGPRAIHMPDIDVRTLSRAVNKEISRLNEDDVDLEEEYSYDEDSEGEIDEEEYGFDIGEECSDITEDSEEEENNEDDSNKSKSESDSESDDDYSDDDSNGDNDKGFIDENMIAPGPKKSRKSVKSEDLFQSLVEKKFSNRKKLKKGSKTNKEKMKN